MTTELRVGSWTPEEDALLKELWCSGMTATKIVESFPERTKNAIIGRVHRLRIERTIPNTGTGHSRIAVVRPQRQTPFKPKAPVVMLEAQPQLFPPAPEGGVSLMELRRNMCRDVIDPHGSTDGLALYCGKRTIDGKSFCSYHAAIYYVPYTARRRG